MTDHLTCACCGDYVGEHVSKHIAALKAEVERCHDRLEITTKWVFRNVDSDPEEVTIPMDERADWPDAVACLEATILLLEEDVAEQAAEIARLREALEPFSAESEYWFTRNHNASDTPVESFGDYSAVMTCGDLFRARAALKGEPK